MKARLLAVLTSLGVVLVSGACAGEQTVDVKKGDRGPPTAPGPFLVVERDVEHDRGHLYIPSSSSSSPDPALFPLPLVVFTPGFAASERDYRETLRYVASHGFVVLGAKHGFDFISATGCMTQREGLEHVGLALEEVRFAARHAGDALFGVIDDRAAIGTFGHSYGGKVALWLPLEGEDVGATFTLDPVDGADDRRPGYCGDDPAGFPRIAEDLPGAPMPPVVLVTAGLSGACAPADGNGAVLFDALDHDAIRLHLPLATHTDFVDDVEDGDCSACSLCPPSEEVGAAVLALSRASAVAFFRHRLLGEKEMARWQLPSSPLAIIGDDPIVERTQK